MQRGKQAVPESAQLRPLLALCRPPVSPGDAQAGPPVSLFAVNPQRPGAAASGASGGERIGAPGLARAVRRAQHSASAVAGDRRYFSPSLRRRAALGTCRAAAGPDPLIWIGTAISFFFLYTPATYNLLEIPAACSNLSKRPLCHGIIRIKRHPQAPLASALGGATTPAFLDRAEFTLDHLWWARPSPVSPSARAQSALAAR